MEAVVCSRVGRIPASLGPSSSEDSTDVASLTVSQSLPRPSVPADLLASGLYVCIRIVAASLNFADVLTVMGKYQERPPLPFIPGAEVSGVVTEVGPAVRRVKVNDRVCAVVGTGAFASEVIAEERKVFLLPAGCDVASAAAIPVAFGTAHLALFHRAGLKTGEVLLVLGAAGGVGLAAVKLGKLIRARVIAVARGAQKAQALREAGADAVINSEIQGVRDGVKEHLQAWAKAGGGAKSGGGRGRKGVDVVFDTVGGKQFEESLKVVSWGARILIIGFASGRIPSVQANVALVKNLTIHGIYWGSYMDHAPVVLRSSMDELLQWIANGSLTFQISHRFSLSQVLQAFETMLQREVIGKVLLLPSATSRL